MGLSQGDPDHRQLDNFRAWMLPALIVGIAIVIAAFSDSGRDWARYDRSAIAAGQLWRLISGHFTHLGFSHLALNVTGMLLIAFLVIQQFRPRQWLGITLFVILGIDAGFWIFEPQLIWYVGLSGLLHGFWAAGAVGGLRTGQRDYIFLLVVLIAKLAYEYFVGPIPGSEESAGGNVVVAAHLYGAISGALIGAWMRFRKPAAAAI